MADGEGNALRRQARDGAGAHPGEPRSDSGSKPPELRGEVTPKPAEPKRVVEAPHGAPQGAPHGTSPARGRKPPTRRRSIRLFLLLLGPLVLIAAGIYMYVSGGRYVTTDNAYVQADKLTVTTDVSGVVASIAVKEGQRVAVGDVLFKLDEEPFRIALDGAQAQLATVAADLKAQQANYQEKLADIKKAEADLDFYNREFERQSTLAATRVASQATLDVARHNRDAAQQSINALQQQAAALLAQLGGSADLPVEQQPRYKQAQANVATAQRNLRRSVVTAPIAGIVTNVDKLQLGQYLPAAQGAFNLVATDQVWIEGNPKETDLTYVTVGDTATVTVDSYPGRTWTGTVCSISPATGAEFSLLPAQNSSGNWVKVVQRIPLRVCVVQQNDGPQLRSGMSVEVEIDTKHQRHFSDLFGWF
jgi:membrane fusion protein (multidrug efflux system)